MLCLGMGGDPLPHASLRGNCAEINGRRRPGSGSSRIGWPITIGPRLRTALLMTCRISGRPGGKQKITNRAKEPAGLLQLRDAIEPAGYFIRREDSGSSRMITDAGEMRCAPVPAEKSRPACRCGCRQDR
jgi:hypothetical protein